MSSSDFTCACASASDVSVPVVHQLDCQALNQFEAYVPGRKFVQIQFGAPLVPCVSESPAPKRARSQDPETPPLATAPAVPVAPAVTNVWDESVFRFSFHQAARTRNWAELVRLYRLVRDTDSPDQKAGTRLAREVLLYDDLALLQHLSGCGIYATAYYDKFRYFMSFALREGLPHACAYIAHMQGGFEAYYRHFGVDACIRHSLELAVHKPLLLNLLIPALVALLRAVPPTASQKDLARELYKPSGMSVEALQLLCDSGLLALLDLPATTTLPVQAAAEGFVMQSGQLALQLGYWGFPDVNIRKQAFCGDTLAVHAVPRFAVSDMTTLLGVGFVLSSHLPDRGMNEFLATLFRAGNREVIGEFFSSAAQSRVDLGHILHRGRVVQLWDILLEIGDSDLLELALDRHALSLSLTDPFDRETLLHKLARCPSIRLSSRHLDSVVRRLDIDAVNSKEQTALGLALLHNNTHLAVYLVGLCANIHTCRYPPQHHVSRLTGNFEELTVLIMAELSEWLDKDQEAVVLAHLRDHKGFQFEEVLKTTALFSLDNKAARIKLARNHRILHGYEITEVRKVASIIENNSAASSRIIGSGDLLSWFLIVEKMQQFPTIANVSPTTRTLLFTKDLFCSRFGCDKF